MEIAIVMPAFNEQEGIDSFIRELNRAASPDLTAHFFVIDDASTDETTRVADSVAETGIRITAETNSINSGHGVSTIKALNRGLASGCGVIVAIDGDGQFIGSDVRAVIQTLLDDPTVSVVEGVRHNRNDPLYRKATSWITCTLVWSRCGVWPMDANSPLRAYRHDFLESVLKRVPSDASTPNLLISVLTRKSKVRYLEVPVRSIPRRGSTTTGTTWGKRASYLPTSRFIKFCGRATRDWVTTRLN